MRLADDTVHHKTAFFHVGGRNYEFTPCLLDELEGCKVGSSRVVDERCDGGCGNEADNVPVKERAQ